MTFVKSDAQEADDLLYVFYKACKDVVQYSNNDYAKAYAKAGLDLLDPNAIRVQCLYILNNMSHWRGDLAKETRATLKRISKE